MRVNYEINFCHIWKKYIVLSFEMVAEFIKERNKIKNKISGPFGLWKK